MNGTMDESMDTSSSEVPYPPVGKSPRSDANREGDDDADGGVTENGHHGEPKPVEPTEADGESSPRPQRSDGENAKSAKKKNSFDPLAESSGDSFRNANANNGNGAGDVHSTTNLGETENSEDSQSTNGDPAEDGRDANDCPNSNDSVGNSVSIGSSRAKNKTDTDDDSEDIQEIRSDSENDRPKPVNVNDESDDLDSEDDSSDDEMSDMSEGGPINEEGPVSIHSDSEPEAVGDGPSDGRGRGERSDKNSEVLLVDDSSNQGENKTAGLKKAPSPVIHEIASDNDDCVVTDEKGADGKKEDPSSIRRSSRIMDKRHYRSQKYDYDDDESDIEEIVADPLNQNRSKAPIVINNAKNLADLALKQNGKSGSGSGQKKEPTVVIIDTNTILSNKTQTPVPSKVPFSSMPPQTLYESMAARGTTVTPLSAKPASQSSASTSSSSSSSSSVVLPSLTDDMFVVEAPSFIVPYVYEKPSVKPFREFVDVLGKELEDQIKKEEQERVEKEKEFAEKSGQNRKESDGADVDGSNRSKERQVEIDDEPVRLDSKRSQSKKARKKKKDDDDASWDGESTSDSEDEGLSDDERPKKTIIIKEKDDDSLDALKDPMLSTDLTSDRSAPKSHSYFDNPLGKFFISIGMNLVQEFVQNDLLKQQKRKLQRENRAGSGNVKATESAISSLMKNLEMSKENNAPYKFEQKKCDFCSFKTESSLSLSHHMETPHMKNGLYKCNFCSYEVRSPHDILFHMEAEHNIRGRLERAPSYHQCPNCPFEDNGKGKLGRHLIACAKKFKPDHNLIPPVEWEPPAKIPKATHAKHTMVNSYQSVFTKMQTNSSMTPGLMPQVVRGRGRPPLLPNLKPIPGTPSVRGGNIMFKPSPPQQVLPNYQVLQNSQQAANLQLPKVLQHQPSISITPLPRTTQNAIPAPTPSSQSTVNMTPGKSTFVICEICDGYIKDLEQLRNHMQWIHKVKIHPKMIYNRPPLNCQKCQFRFFTDQGLERHLLGSHGLVTSSMQEAANKGKDSGRCPICGRVYQWKLLNHVARDHNMTLKPAHLSYKCTVCTATFGMYRQFENHVYSAHSVVAKRAVDKTKGPSGSGGGGSSSLLKPVN